jgi:hypothetical protein
VAYKVTPLKKGIVTSINVYLDATSAATLIYAGIYSDNSGHPGSRLSQGSLSNPVAGTTNTVNIADVIIDPTKNYWIAFLGSQGTMKYRDRLGYGNTPMETSSSTALTTLPSTWTTGQISNNGPITGIGRGYLDN